MEQINIREFLKQTTDITEAIEVLSNKINPKPNPKKPKEEIPDKLWKDLLKHE